MSIFNSLGSNYDFKFVLKTLLSVGGESEKRKLKETLRRKYKGEVLLFYKGREALTFALKSLSLPEESKTAINGFTCYAVYKAVEEAGLKPVLLDIDDSLNFSPEKLKSIIESSDIKVVIVQNTLGYICEIKEIAKICKKNNIILIEDLAHCVGTNYENGEEAGTVGDFVVFSFSQDKMVDGISGGALIAKIQNSKFKIQNYSYPQFSVQIKNRLYPLLTFIIRSAYDFGLGKLLHYFLKKSNMLSTPMDDSLYGTLNLSDFYQSLVMESFNNLKGDLEHRKKIAKIYKNNLPSKILFEKITSQIENSSNLRFPIFVENRDKLLKFLKSKGFYISDIWYDAPISPKRFMQKIEYAGDCPNAEEISERILNLPTHKNISEKQALKLAKYINNFLIHNS